VDAIEHTPRQASGRRRRVAVLVAERRPLFLEAVARAVRSRPELELVAECATAAEAQEEIERLRPEVALLDLGLPGLGASELLEGLAQDGQTTRVLFLSDRIEASVAYDVVGSGAAGYLSKGIDANQLCDAIAAVARGQVVLAPEVQTGLASEIRLRRADGRPLLSERERQILGLVADGLTAPQMATRLHLSVGTVKTHLLHVYEKLGVSERAAAVAEAMRRGLLK
jgi:two-component system nitrate/nitrite response regulator NarL